MGVASGTESPMNWVAEVPLAVQRLPDGSGATATGMALPPAEKPAAVMAEKALMQMRGNPMY